MVAGKVRVTMGLQKSPAMKSDVSSKPTTPGSAKGSSPALSRYFPRASAQVQPRLPDVAELLRLVEELRERESRLKTELLEHKLLRESVAILPVLEDEILKKKLELERCKKKTECLETENERLRQENEFLHVELAKQNHKYEEKIKSMQADLADIKRAVEETQRDQQEDEASSSSATLTYHKPASSRFLKKCMTQNSIVEIGGMNLKPENETKNVDSERPRHCRSNSDEGLKSRAPRVPKPPPRPSASCSSSSSVLSSCQSSPSYGSLSDSADRALAEISNIPPPPPPPVKIFAPKPPPPPPLPRSKAAAAVPPPPPPPPKGTSRPLQPKVRRVPEVVEFYHSLMRRDSYSRRDSGGGSGGATAKDMIGEIENRSTHLLAIKTDVETQGEFIKFLIKEVEGAVFTDIEDVVPFVKWLDDELSYLVDERAVLKHFDWPEQKADVLREAAFGYCDLKKLESEASLFRDDPRQPCAHALKKMQSLFEKLEHGVYNLSRMRESATKRYKAFHIPMNWMLDNSGYASQIKMASVKLALKYMKRVSAELETIWGGPEEEELIIQGVKFAFRVHQFAGGFDVETMKAFEEVRDKAQSCNVQHLQKLVSRSSSTQPAADSAANSASGIPTQSYLLTSM